MYEGKKIISWSDLLFSLWHVKGTWLQKIHSQLIKIEIHILFYDTKMFHKTDFKLHWYKLVNLCSYIFFSDQIGH